MNILDVMSTCNDVALANILSVVKNILLIIQIVAPILLIITGVIEFTRLSINPEDKKGFRKILNKIIAAFIIFLIPVLINAVMGLVGESTKFSSCWNNANDTASINNDTYIDDDTSIWSK